MLLVVRSITVNLTVIKIRLGEEIDSLFGRLNKSKFSRLLTDVIVERAGMMKQWNGAEEEWSGEMSHENSRYI